MDDAELVRRIKKGELQYLTPLIERHYASIEKYCYWKVGKVEEAQDLTQETFYRFCRNFEQYNHAGKCRAYLYTIARHLCCDYLQDKRMLSMEEVTEGQCGQTLSMEEKIDNELLIYQLVNDLPTEQREALYLRFCMDLTFREIAEITGTNIWVVQYRVKRGLNVLRKRWERKEKNEETTKEPHPRNAEKVSCSSH